MKLYAIDLYKRIVKPVYHHILCSIQSQTGGGRKQARLACLRRPRRSPMVRELGCVLTIPAPAAGELIRALRRTGGDLEADLRQALAAIQSMGTGVHSGFQAE